MRTIKWGQPSFKSIVVGFVILMFYLKKNGVKKSMFLKVFK